MSAVPVLDLSELPASTTPSRRTVRSWTAGLTSLGVVLLLLGWLLFVRSPFVLSGDDAMYVILAKALATGRGFHFLNLPGAPAATHFPPGYPALLAVLWRIAPEFPANLALFKAVNAIALALIAVGSARFARAAGIGERSSLGLGLLIGISGPMLVLGNMVLSELVFLAMLMFLLPALERFAATGAGRPLLAVAAGVAIGACILVRTHAIVLVPALCIVLATRRRWRDAAIVALVACCCILPWQLWSSRHAGVLPAPLLGQYDSYLGWWMRGCRAIGSGMIPLTLSHTLADGGQMFAVLFSPGRNAAAHVATLLSLALVSGLGIVATRQRLPVTALFLAGYLCIVALWPFPPARFIWGVWPLVLFLLAAGARDTRMALSRWRAIPARRRILTGASLAACAWIATGYAAYELRAIRGRWWMSIPRANAARIVPAVRWTLANTAPSDLLAAEDDGALYLYTGRRALPIRTFAVQQYLFPISPRVEAEQGLLPLLAAYPIRVVVVGSPMTFATVQWAATLPTPLVALREQFAEGAAFTVLAR